MDKLVIGIIVCIILVGATFWLFNNDDGFNDAVENGGRSVNRKMTNFDYSGTAGPSTATHNTTEWATITTDNTGQ